MTKREQYFYNKAKDAMNKSSFFRIRIGCIIVKGSKILSRGCNVEKSHPKQKYLNKKYRGFNTHNSYIHAELNAILNTNAHLTGATMYLYREDNNGVMCCCRPCPACEFVLRQAGITTVYYTDYNKYVKEELL